MRLKPDVTPQQTSSELNAIIGEFVRQYKIQLKPALLPLHETMVRNARTGLLLLLAIVATMLLIVCVNVATFMLVRTAGRDREFAVRTALGSSRGRLFALVFNDALLLVTVGTFGALAVARGGLKAFERWAPSSTPRIADIHAGPNVWLFTIAMPRCRRHHGRARLACDARSPAVAEGRVSGNDR